VSRHPVVTEVVRRDPRYAYEAYEFLYRALRLTQEQLGIKPSEEGSGDDPTHHVTGKQLLHGVKDLAHKEYGRMARIVFKNWGINETVDFGNMVFNLVEAGLMFRRPEDSLADFQNIYNLDEALVRDYEFRMEDSE
jgi:uncharacterized repeat protein (TIGR04138 family)